MAKYYQPEIETAPREKILEIQNEKLVKQIHHVWDNVPYYRHLMEEKGLTPDDIKTVDDIHKLPFLSKADLRETYPYGLLGTDLKNCVRIHSTSGTTGKRVVAFYTQHDIDLWEDCCARAIVAAGGTEEDVVQVCYGYGLFTGGSGLHGGSHKVGCLTLPMSSGNTERQIQFMMDLESTIICCTPSYAAYIGESLKEQGFKPELYIEPQAPIEGLERKPAAPGLPSNARNRRACISMKTISMRKSLIRTPAKCCLKDLSANWSSPLWIRKRSRCSVTAPVTFAS